MMKVIKKLNQNVNPTKIPNRINQNLKWIWIPMKIILPGKRMRIEISRYYR